jgi:hypothetical protein
MEKLLQLVKQRRQQQTAGRQSAWNCFWRHEQAREQLKPSKQEKIKNFDDVLKIMAYKIEIAAFERMKELDGKMSSKLRKMFTSISGRYAMLHTVMRRTSLVSRLITVVPRDLLQPTITPSHASLEQSKMPFCHVKRAS